MLVDGPGDLGAGVPEALGDDLYIDVGLEREGGPRVPQVVQADAGQPVTGDAPLEGVGEVLGVLRMSVGAGEYEVVVLIAGPSRRRSWESCRTPLCRGRAPLRTTMLCQWTAGPPSRVLRWRASDQRIGCLAVASIGEPRMRGRSPGGRRRELRPCCHPTTQQPENLATLLTGSVRAESHG